MVSTRLFAVATVLLLMAAVPAAAQPETPQTTGIQNPKQSTPVTLYYHLDGIQDFPINTQMPDDRYTKGNPYGLTTNSVSCLGRQQAGGATNSYHTYYGYSTPGYVEYDFEEDGGPRYHKERGLSFDVLLDTAQPFTVYWYLQTQATSAQSEANNLPVVVPNVVVRAMMRSGDDVSVGDEAFNAGTVIAEGRTDPAHLSPYQTLEGHPHVTHHEAQDGSHVYEFAVPLTIKGDRIDRDESYNLRIDVFMDNPACNDPTYSEEDKYLMANAVRPYTAPGFRPRMDLAILNPVRIEYLHPQFIGDDLVIHTSVNSPWGNYDVDEREGGIELTIDGPTPATSLARAAFVQRHHEHNHHQEAVDITYIWPYKQDKAKDGVYTINFRVKNDQDTAEAVGKVQFQIGKSGGKDALPACDPDVPVESQVNCRFVAGQSTGSEKSPGVGVVALLGLVAVAAAVLRRRR